MRLSLKHFSTLAKSTLILAGVVAASGSLKAQSPQPELPVSKRLCCCPAAIPANAVTFLAVAGESLPAPRTLGDVLGAANEYGFSPGSFGPSPTTDQFRVSVNGGTIRRVYYESQIGTGSTGWKDVGNPFGPSLSSATLDVNSGIVAFRAPGSAITLPVYSHAEEDDVTIGIQTGLAIYSWPYAQAVTLNESGLSSVLSPGSFGPNPNTDQVLIESGGVISRYYFESQIGTGSVGWKPVGNPFGPTVGDSVTIALCKGFGIERAAAGGATSLATQLPAGN